MDIQSLLTGILDKHDGDENFRGSAQSDPKSALIEHFGEEAIGLIKEHLNEDTVKDLFSGKADLAEIAKGFLEKK